MGLLSGKPRATNQVIIEPLGLIFTNWQLVRSVGSSQANQVLEQFQATSLTHSSLREIIGRAKHRTKHQLISNQELPLLGERRVIETNGRTIQAVIGLPSELQTLVSASTFHTEALIAVEHGLLPLVVATSASTKPDAKFGYVGTLLFEPKCVPYKGDAANIRVLSVLPAMFVNYYYQQFGAFSDLAVDAASFLYDTPQKIEKIITQAAIIGAANLRERYQLLALLSTHNSYQFVSNNIQDEQLQQS